MDPKVQIKQLGDALRNLCDFVPLSKSELKEWYDQAQQLIDNQIKATSNDVPHFLWHYLSDADIRMKDREYAAMQNRRIEALLDHLERGILPAEGEI